MADRYNAMAETMNKRGAMELAVPFYRQAIALLMAERETLQRQLGNHQPAAAQELALDELHGLLEAAEHVQLEQAAQVGPDLETRIAELGSELERDTAAQVIAGLRGLAEQAQAPLPPAGWLLMGKAHMLLGQQADGLHSFEGALAAAPGSVEAQINTGAARLANGDVQGAVSLLRQTSQVGLDTFKPEHRRALLRNLAAAEAQAGERALALHWRLQWLEDDPQAVPIERWIGWATESLPHTSKGEPEREAALALLNRLHQLAPGHTTVMQVLAEALEDQGDFREASLLYRQLLRPQG